MNIKWYNKEKEREYWLLASVWLNLILSVGKLAWGWYFGATIVTADGIHSISDVFGAFLVFMALRFAGHKSKRFPFGLYKLEDLAATIGGIAILLAGYEIIRTVFNNKGIQTPKDIWGTLIFIAVIIIIEIVFYFFERKAAIRLKSPGVKTDSVNWLGDIGAGAVVFSGILSYHFGVPYAQKVAVIIIVIMIFYGAWGILRDAILSLLEASVDNRTLQQAQNAILSFPEVEHVNELFIRRSGSILIADIVLEIKEKNMLTAHLIIDKIEEKLHKTLPNLATVTIHYEPIKKQFIKKAILLTEDKKTISNTFHDTKWIRVTDITDTGEIINDNIIPNPVQQEQKGKPIRLAAWLIKQQVNKVIFDPDDLSEDIKILFSAMGIEIEKE